MGRQVAAHERRSMCRQGAAQRAHSKLGIVQLAAQAETAPLVTAAGPKEIQALSYHDIMISVAHGSKGKSWPRQTCGEQQLLCTLPASR
jgi:hypothetical protein